VSGFNLADLFEQVADEVPDREAIVSPARRLTYAELDRRANALAHALHGLGVGAGDHIGLQLLNGSEYVEGMLAAFKLSAVPVNVNYRYVEQELRQLYTDADLVAVIHHQRFGPRVTAAAVDVATLSTLIGVADDSGEPTAPDIIDYETLLAAAPDTRPSGVSRTGDDRYIAYTGGTTGLPKGVVWRQEDIFFAAMGGGDPYQSGNVISTPDELAGRVPEIGGTYMTTPPLMHVSAQWGVFHSMFSGGRVVFAAPGRFEPDTVWSLIESETVNVLTIVGDAMALPLADALERARDAGKPYDVSSLIVIGSGGAVLSSQAKNRLTVLLPTVMVVDGFGSSETGVIGSRLHVVGDGSTAPRFTVDQRTQVLDEYGRPVTPGSGEVGRLARTGRVPLGYYKDEAKTRATIVEFDGARWVMPGDHATVDADGTVVLLGRGSTSINTGGEKVYPEEVETVLRTSPDVADVIVVGMPDPHWGQRVVAVVEAVPGSAPDLESLRGHASGALADYKLPREVVLVDRVERTPAGKADYTWARAAAEAAGVAR
jgi:acyl-CoA synthetase (AMP-forming)/AMP-acid ligase II